MTSQIKKHALIIGINYRNTANELHGCIADSLNIIAFLKSNLGYLDNEITHMTDDVTDKTLLPTKENIIRQMQKLVENNDAYSRLFCTFSGHGCSTPCLVGNEDDGKCENIYTLDEKMIVDDDLRTILVDPLKEGAQLFCIFDSCHSGTVINVRYNYKVSLTPSETYGLTLDRQYKDSKGQVICFSGCRDEQTSADAFEEGKSQGALTYCFLKTMDKLKSKNKFPTYRNMMKNLTIFIAQRGYSQVPQMSSGKNLNLDDEIKFL